MQGFEVKSNGIAGLQMPFQHLHAFCIRLWDGAIVFFLRVALVFFDEGAGARALIRAVHKGDVRIIRGPRADGTVDGRLIALDAKSGKTCADFGANGTVNALEGLGEHPLGEYRLTTPGGIIGDLSVIGGAISDNLKTTVPGGVVRAYDLNTGELAWYWDPIPPGQEPVLEGDEQKIIEIMYEKEVREIYTQI